MNRDKRDRQLLLLASGELSARQRKRLERKLAGNADAQAWQRDVQALLAAARRARPDGEPSPAARRSLRQAAADRTQRDWLPEWIRMPVVAWSPVVVAALVLAAGASLLITADRRPNRIGQVGALVAMAATEDYAATAEAVAADDDADLRSLARMLLEMEGLSLDATSADYAGEEEAVSPDAEPVPTVLQPRSIPGPPARTYG
jgi:hypothetical protein